MTKKISSLPAWLAGANAVMSGYILWTFLRAVQYMPATDAPPDALITMKWGLILFEIVSIIVSVVYLRNKQNEGLAKVVYGVCLVQLVAIATAPFLITAIVWPRVI